MTQQRLSTVLTLGALLAIVSATLYPDPEAAYRASQTPLWCILCGGHGAVDFLLNVALFIPLGAGLGLRGCRMRFIVAVALGLSLSIEFTQALVLTGRDPSLGDLLANTGGACVGGALARTWSSWVLPTPFVARRLTIAAVAGWLAVMGFTTWALQPSAPNGKYFGQWQPQLQGMETFDGTVLRAFLNRLPLPQGPAQHSDEFQQEALDPTGGLEATVITGNPTTGFAPVIALAHADKYHVLSIGQVKDQVAHYRRLRATDLRFRSPALRLRHGFPDTPGDTIKLVGRRDAHLISIIVEHRGRMSTAELELSPYMGWALLNPLDLPLGRLVVLGNALWIAGWMVLVGWWSSFATERTTALLATLLASGIVGLVLIPLATGFSIARWPEWMSLAIGWAAGYWSARPARKRQTVGGRARVRNNQDTI